VKKGASKIPDSSSDAQQKSGLQSMLELEIAIHALDSVSEAISITDAFDILLYVNNSFLSMYGYETDELIGRHISLVGSLRNDPGIYDEILSATAGPGWHGRLINTRKNGEEFTIELNTSIVRDNEGNPIAFIGVAKDLTELLKTEDRLREIEDKYRNLFLSLREVIFERTPDGKFLELNPSGLELFGYDESDLEKIDILKDIYADEKDRVRFQEAIRKDGFVKDFEKRIKTKSGEILTVLDSSIAVRNSGGEIISYRGILRDITEKKRNEEKIRKGVEKLESINEQLRKSEQELKNINATKDKFFSLIAHDLRSPFSAIMNLSHTLAEEFDSIPTEDLKYLIGRLDSSSKSYYALLENLLQWSRIQTGRVEYEPNDFFIYEKINQAIHLLNSSAEKKEIKIINGVDPSVAVFADDSMIYSVLQNLLSNAIKFSFNFGIVTFSSEIEGNKVLISITDNGIGISEENLNKIFRIDVPHTTLGTNNEKGNGLGLIICKEMIEYNKGEITVRSIPNKGTNFTFSLPKSED
jgi:PAS domain S-box-containing protein